MTLDKINLDGAERIAFADTKHLGRPRWSELSVYHLPEADPKGRRWVALSVGMSSKANEVPLTDTLCTFSLERALDLFDESPIGRQVKAQARDWAEQHPDEKVGEGEAFTLGTSATITGQGALATQAPPRFAGSTDEEALAWIFPADMSLRRQAEAFNMGESTLRMALKNRTEVRVPLVMAARYFDRERFLADLRADAAAVADADA